jgi:UDP:flavonoid glycosyltransferase YjiC (YdhE family)
MRVLFGMPPMAGHARSIAPLADALRAGGHDIVAVGRPNVVPGILARHIPAFPVGEPLDIVGGILKALPAGSSVQEMWGRSDGPEHLVGVAHHYVGYAEEVIDEVLEFARAWRPDVVVYDPLDFAARVAAAALGVPAVRHRWATDPYGTITENEAVDSLAAVCTRLGIDSLEPALVLDPCPPSLQLPGVVQGLPVRYVQDNGVGVVPQWSLNASTRPTVCVCPGTEALTLGGAPGFRNALLALERMDVDVIAAVSAANLDLLGELPSRIRVVDMVPLHMFLHQCTAIVHHGGAGCLLTSVAAGLPQLVLPVIADQYANGDQITAYGAGLTLPTMAEQRDPEAVAQALKRLVTDDSLAERAAQLKAEHSVQSNVFDAVTALAAL